MTTGRIDLRRLWIDHALAYYHDHPRKMSDVEAEREQAMDAFRDAVERPDGVDSDV